MRKVDQSTYEAMKDSVKVVLVASAISGFCLACYAIVGVAQGDRKVKK